MPNFSETLRLKEKAEEDIYFAKLDRELIAALHKKTIGTLSDAERKDARKLSKAYRKDLKKMAKSHLRDHEKLSRHYARKLRKLLHLD